MGYQEYLIKIQEIQSYLLKYLDDESYNEKKYQNLIKTIKSYGIQEEKEELKLFLKLLATVSSYHYRVTNFKIERIIQFLRVAFPYFL